MITKTEMSEVERLGARVLERCSFTPGCWDKRFARSLHETALGPALISDRQRAWLWKLIVRYRRQISNTPLIKFAEAQLES